MGHDEYSSKWGLSTLQRDDILQADIAPLMAHLIGIDIPVNSVGELPLSYLNANGSTKAEAAFTNARQILEQLRVKHSKTAFIFIVLLISFNVFRRKGTA